MTAEVKQFTTRRDKTFAEVKELLADTQTDAAIVITHTRDGFWHVAHSCEDKAVTSIETVGILEMVKQDVIVDYNGQQT